MSSNDEIKYMNSFGILLKEGLVFSDYNSKIVIDYESIKKIQLLKSEKDVINKYLFLGSLIVLIVSLIFFNSQFLLYYLLPIVISFGILITPFVYKKYEYYLVLRQKKIKDEIRFKVKLNHKEDAKDIIEKVIYIIDHK